MILEDAWCASAKLRRRGECMTQASGCPCFFSRSCCAEFLPAIVSSFLRCPSKSERGGPTDWRLVTSGKYTIGGAGIVFTEGTAVEEYGRKTTNVPAFIRTATLALSQDYRIHSRPGHNTGHQLGHPGRKHRVICPGTIFRADRRDAARGLRRWRGIWASAVPDPRPGSSAPIAMSVADIRQMIKPGAIRRCVASMPDSIYRKSRRPRLPDSSVSQSAGKPAQRWLRQRFPGPHAFRARNRGSRCTIWPQDQPVFFRCSATDGPGLEWTIEDTVVLSRELMARGVDVITCSSGGIAGPINTALVPRTPGYHVAYADRIRREVGIKTVAVGLITEAHHAEQISVPDRRI